MTFYSFLPIPKASIVEDCFTVYVDIKTDIFEAPTLLCRLSVLFLGYEL